MRHYTHEGGIASPLIAHWPAQIKKSRWESTPASLIDIMPTLVEVGQAEYPFTYKNHSILPMEGQSLVPIFSSRGNFPEHTLFWEHEWNAAIRQGDWKLVRNGRGNPWELYDMKEDRTELHNLAQEKPEVAEAMKAEWKQWAGRVYVFPKN